MALIHRQLRAHDLTWEAEGEAVSPYTKNGEQKTDFSPRLVVDRAGQVHVIFMNYLNVSYVDRTGEKRTDLIEDVCDQPVADRSPIRGARHPYVPIRVTDLSFRHRGPNTT